MTTWKGGKRFDRPDKCGNPTCPQCCNQFGINKNDPNQQDLFYQRLMSLLNEGEIHEVLPEVFETDSDPGDENEKATDG